MLNAFRALTRGLKDGAVEGRFIALLTPALGAQRARQVVEEAAEAAREKIRAEGADRLPDRYGDVLLWSSDPRVQAALDAKRAEGATDDDIREWWNMSPLERELEIVIDSNATRIAMLMSLMESGLSQEEAGKTMRRTLAMYGDPGAPSPLSGDDRPLPWEMKRRVIAFLQQRARAGRDENRAWLDGAPTVNAFIRREMRAGRF